MIYYFEKVGLFQLLSLWVTKRSAFYAGKSIATRLFEKFVKKIELPNLKRIDFGDLQTTTDIRRHTHQSAERCLEQLTGQRWAAELTAILGIDFWLVVRGFFLEDMIIIPFV